MKVSELDGTELARWVARANKNYVDAGQGVFDAEDENYIGHIGGSIQPYAPHEDWSQGGQLIEKHGIDLEHLVDPVRWRAVAYSGGYWVEQEGPTPLLASMRALVASVYGDEVES